MTLQDIFSIRVHHGYILQIFFAEMLFYFVLKKRDHFIVRLICGFILYAFLSIIVSNCINTVQSGLNSISIFIISLGYFSFMFKNKFKDILFCCVGAQFIQNLSHNLKMLIYLPLADKFNDIGWLFLSLGMSIIVYLASYFIIIRRLIGDDEISIHSAGVFGIAVASALFCYLVQYLFQIYEIDRYWVTTLPLIFCCVVSLIAQFGLLAYRKKIEENAKLESYINRESKIYETYKDTIDVINMKAHDLKHFINDIDRNKNIGSFDGLDEIKEAVDKYDHTPNTGNSILDTLLSEKMYLCQKNKIDFSMIVEGEALCFMKTSDIVSLFGNSLSNAIECECNVLDEPKRCIFLKVFKRGQMVSIHVENYCEVEPKISNGLIKTTKDDHNQHGFGLKSMNYIVKKYDGTMNISYDDNLFKLDMLIPFYESKQL